MATRWFLGISIPVYLILLWFNSGISATKGVYFFGGGLLLLAICLALFRRGKSKPLFSLYFATLLLGFLIACCEGVLHLAPNIVKGKAAIYAYQGYHTDPGGIYVNDLHMGYKLRSNCSQQIYWNGHWWHHQTNEDGYRGQRLDRADAIFLGDSMIYGHGVDNEGTVATRFAEQTGLAVANLGQQGTCLVQMWLRLREFAPKLKPKYVFVCVHPNDGGGCMVLYPEDELQRFIDSPLEEDYLPKVVENMRPKTRFSLRSKWNEHIALPLRTARLFRYVLKRVREVNKHREEPQPAPSPTPGYFVPSQGMIDQPFDAEAPKEQLGWKAQLHALGKIKRICDRHKAQLIVFDLGYPKDFSRTIQRWTQELGATYSPAGEQTLQHSLNGEGIYLENDGHWTGTGAGLVADNLADTFERASNHPE